MPQRELMARYGVSERTVRRAIKRSETTWSLPHAPPLTQHLDDLWARLVAANEDLALARIAAHNPRTQVAALRRQLDVMAEQRQILAALRGGAGQSVSLERIHEKLLAAARRDQVGAEVEAWLRDAFHEATGP